MPKLHTVIINKEKDGYIEDEHYKYFTTIKNTPGGKNTNKKIVKELYLTYEGILRLLYTSRSPNARKFRKWSTEKLFTIQLGSKEQKENLFNKLLGVPTKNTKETLKTHSCNISCIYLYTLGMVKDLRKSLDISEKYNDTDIVCKFGKSNNLLRRNDEHDNDYGKIPNVNLRLKIYSYIDEQYLTQAENDIKNLIKFYNLKFIYENKNEMIIVPADKMELIKNEFDRIRQIYAGEYNKVINIIEKQKLEIEYLKKENKINNEYKDFKIKIYEQILQNNGLSNYI
jgi:hypothetical protein